ncbi:hypothetical protein OUZ56_014724 [Daphnia magna]|uniref:Uncharacterized protein n=1 Tax=Daphnia magna TaxID=35525 RepID=A0ABR0AKN1_9CRUS|nr:hypothetical protein OUZ56_014724 [Daphnia magna]
MEHDESSEAYTKKKIKKREEEKRKGHPGQWSPKRSVRARPKRANYLLNWQEGNDGRIKLAEFQFLAD